jgi:hypothetical protein
METVLHPLVAVALCVSIILIWFLRRRYAIGPFLLVTFLIPLGQVVVIGGVHFTVLRIATLCGLARFALSGTARLRGRFNAIDGSFLLWAVACALSFVLLYMDGQALINRLGFLLDAIGGYFLLRCLIQKPEDVYRVIRWLIFILTVMAVCMVIEHITRHNLFGLLGGVRPTPEVRDGKIRANGVFQHSILAGCFGATMVPLCVILWKQSTGRATAMLGLISSTVVMLTASASTALLAFAAGILGLCLWPIRNRMRWLRWMLVSSLLVLHLVMKAPVWAIIGRIDLTGSSSGYHRYMLVDTCIRHFSDWWLIGTKHYNEWGADMWDLSDQYVAYAVTGGLATLVFFIAIIFYSFRELGTTRKYVSGDKGYEWLLWCLGASLFAHVMGYFGIGYFDQMQVVWFALLAMISATTTLPIRPYKKKLDGLLPSKTSWAPELRYEPSVLQEEKR